MRLMHIPKADREASRAQFVAECEERRWRESCDVLRDKESKEYVRNIAADRRGQLAERAAAAAAAAEAERVFVRQSEAEKARVDAREEFDRARLRKLNADCRLTLEEQVRAPCPAAPPPRAPRAMRPRPRVMRPRPGPAPGPRTLTSSHATRAPRTHVPRSPRTHAPRTSQVTAHEKNRAAHREAIAAMQQARAW